LAPENTPAPIVTRLNTELVRVLRDPQTQRALIARGSEPVGNSRAAFAAFVRSEHERWAKVIKQAGITMD